MKPQLKSSPAARELIQRFEPYRELAARGSDGRWGVGFGHRAAAREGVRVTRDDASLLLIYDVMQAEAVIDEMFPQGLPKMQRDALTSFVHDIGAAAFRNSDVARYLFEGRVEPAAEALASYGEGRADRREAESAMVLAELDNARAASAPVRKPALVDLVIKVEHPAEDIRVADRSVRSRPALPDSLMPPPPPPIMTPQVAARREAEGEIARILATVGAMPHDEEPSQAETPAGGAVIEPVSEPAVEPVAGPVSESVIEPVVEPAVEPAAELAVEDISAVDTAEPETNPLPFDGITSAAPTASEIDPEIEAENDIDLAPATEPATEPATAPVSAQVIARMSQEIAHVQSVIIGREQSQVSPPAGGGVLPDGVSLGYVFTGAMWAGLAPEDETHTHDLSLTVVAEQPVIAPEAEPQDDIAAAAGADTDNNHVEDLQEAVPEAVDAASDAAPADLAPAAAAIDELTPAETGHEAPPPHPGAAHASSDGAVGDIAGEAAHGDSRTESVQIAHLDDLAGTSGAAKVDADEDDPFSPSDLVGSTDLFVDGAPVEVRKEEDGWGFGVTLIAGLVVAGAGVFQIYGDWPRVWLERDPTWGVLAAVAGGFLAVTAAWMLWSVLAEKRRKNRAN